MIYSITPEAISVQICNTVNSFCLTTPSFLCVGWFVHQSIYKSQLCIFSCTNVLWIIQLLSYKHRTLMSNSLRGTLIRSIGLLRTLDHLAQRAVTAEKSYISLFSFSVLFACVGSPTSDYIHFAIIFKYRRLEFDFIPWCGVSAHPFFLKLISCLRIIYLIHI